MIDFLIISTRRTNRGVVEIYPKFRLYPKSTDLMIRGGDFYAVWMEDRGLWSTNESDLLSIIDRELDKYAEENRERFDDNIRVLHMWDSESGMIDAWHRYCQKQMRDSYHSLDETLVFSNSPTNKLDYASKRLSYPLEAGSIAAYDKLISTLYTEEERHKIEWAIGSIVHGDSKTIQKFVVLYGAAGTGKSTILNIIQQLFDGYYSVFDAKALGSNGSQFALEAFRKNPLVAIQHDGDLSKIEDNTRLNSLVSHELMNVNEKYTKGYENRFKCFLFMGTNRPVKITDGKSGLIRRLIDVSPSGNKLGAKEYKTIMKQVSFELGAIAHHCREVYMDDPGYYDDYIPVSMMGASNDFYNFVMDSYHIFKKEDGTTMKAAWEMYKTYCEEAKVPYALSQRNFREELKNYFREYSDRFNLGDGSRVRSYYEGFKTEIFELPTRKKDDDGPKLIDFQEIESIFDKERAECYAQYASYSETPVIAWDDVETKLADLNTSRLHYVRPPENHIVIDFDIKDENGNKSLEKNLAEASKWPPTYAELSKSGQGIHLHYIYTGDVERLSHLYAENIEIKVFTGKSSLRRKLTKCNNLPIATISSGLPLKEEKPMVDIEGFKNERMLRAQIEQNLQKRVHGSTKSSIDFIKYLLDEAYASGAKYDVSDMYNRVMAFAAQSTNNSNYCMDVVDEMKFKSEEEPVSIDIGNDADAMVFYDIEVFPNLFLVNCKVAGEGKTMIRLINPSSEDIEQLLDMKLVGFNCRRYDNHIMYARLLGHSVEELYQLSQRIISGDRTAFFGDAYNISYTDVYDFSSKKQSLKKWEIELGIHHQELGLPWDQPVPEELWPKVSAYCDNDVMATEAVFNHLKGDWTARQILAAVAGGTVNDTTNSLTTKIIFGGNRSPQSQFNYRNLAEPLIDLDVETYEFLKDAAPEMLAQTHGEAESVLPYFPGYKYEYGKSTYRGEEVGEGGYVYAEPGIYTNVALLDVASMHPTSAICEVLFGVLFTSRFKAIKDARVYIKHKDYEKARTMLDGKLAPFLNTDDPMFSPGDLAQALKIAINSVYGLTAAAFMNAFKDIRNIDNIVAKRGALFMIDLKNAVQERGFTVVHIKTDSIKIADATPEIIEFVMNFGKKYGYTFEHEDTYDRICLVNDAVYIAKYETPHIDKDTGKEIRWTATGTQFQVPYVFKTLFSKEPIEFKDMCETKSVSTALYLKGENEDPMFIGKVGLFCPVKKENGGMELLRIGNKDADGNVKFSAATGTKGFEWLEAESVKTLGKEKDIDRSYYDGLVNDAVDAIGKYGDTEWFMAS